MGLPSENRPVAPSNGTFDNDYPPGANEPQSHGQEDAGDTEVRNAPAQPETPGRLPEANSEQQLAERPRGGSRRPSGAVKEQRMCGKCGTHLTGQFVRALGGTYHLECFTCHDCNKIVASKFFPVPDQPPNQYPLCETDYFRRLDLLCYACKGALRGSYITALDRKYHIEHFTCSVCPTVFGAQDSYYEHESNVYCHYHYSTKFAQKCNGCQTAILKQFVEIFRNGVNQHWHPECYMIHKYWNVRLHAPPAKGTEAAEIQETEALREGEDLPESEANEELRRTVRTDEEAVEHKVHWIWQTLSQFEERSATCISDMLLHVSNGAYMDGVVAAKKFITHVDLLFSAADSLDHRLQNRPASNAKGVRTFDNIVHPGLSYSREAKLLCKKVVAFFQLLAESQDTGVRRLGVTQELLSLVTGLAHYLKLMIRICLSGALKLERDTRSSEGLELFLADIGRLDECLEAESNRDSRADADAYVDRSADTCPVCNKAVEDKSFRKDHRVIHTQCLCCSKCGKDFSADPGSALQNEANGRIFCDVHASPEARTGGFASVTRLQQYVHLLRVAHARLLATLRTSGALPHTSDDPNLGDYNSREGHTPSNEGDPPMLGSSTRSRSYAGRSDAEKQQNDYEDTMGDIRRLRSTRMDKHLSNAGRHARTSRIIEGPEGMRPGSADGPNRRQTGTFQIVEDRDSNGELTNQLTFGRQDTMTLDDIPRIVQAQQTREQRPNASRYARQPMIPQEPKLKLVNGHQSRDLSQEDKPLGDHRLGGTKKYFSELTALEYFIVRHVAVLSMEPLLEGHFNQEELLDLIETKRPTFWSKFGKAFAPKEKRPKANKNAIFGVPLELLLERDYEESTDCVGPGSLKVPSLVQEAVSAMKTMDMSVEGVFRKNGNIKRLNDVKAEIDAKGVVEVDLSKENPVQVAALLKKFLRELPDPLLTHKLFKLWITSQRIEESDRRRRLLHLTCCLLPKAHRDTLEVLFTFMNWVSSFSHVDEESGSKMDIHNLATVITPNVLYSPYKDEPRIGKPEGGVDETFLAIEAVHSLIECNESMCEVPEDLALILNDSGLWSNNAEITTKEILKRYGDRAKAPAVGNSFPHDLAEHPPRSSGTAGGVNPVVTRVDTDPHQQDAWRNESSVRAVAAEGGFNPPHLPYSTQQQNGSTESHGGSPTRNGGQRPVKEWDNRGQQNRAMGVA